LAVHPAKQGIFMSNTALKNESLNLPPHAINEIDSLMYTVTKRVRAIINCAVGVSPQIEAIECRTRDGFIPYSQNKGGYEIELPLHSCQVCDIDFYDEYNEYMEYLHDCLSDEEKLMDDEAQSDRINAMDDEAMALIYFSIQLNDENTATIKFGVYFSDAPYFRKETDKDTVNEEEIEFNSVTELSDKLNKFIKENINL